jgi:ankyrin repeat protein/mono/diheme cytochrome c family protein
MLSSITFALIPGYAAVAMADPVDFARDIQPLLQEHCIECHGPEQQKNGYRLDRRSSALSGALRRNIMPGSSAGSVVYHRVATAQLGAGPRMPPKDPLAQEDIDLLKRWIDEGAVWPDALANEVEVSPPNAAAVRLCELIRLDDRKAALEEIRKQPSIVNERGPRGSTPLMYAALYGDAALLAAMLQVGGDPNIRNDAGSTALIWAIEDLDKVRLLLDRGADPNAASAFGRTPLMLATGLGRSELMAKLLLERGAVAVPPALAASAFHGNAATVRLLLAAGVHDNGIAASLALRFNCVACFEAINSDRPIPPLPRALLDAVPPAGPANPQAILNALEHGGDVNARDPAGRSVLMTAAISETITPEAMQLLIDRGADIHVKDRGGLTALDYARRVGREPIVNVLTKAGASATASAEPVAVLVTNNDARAAVARSVPLLQRTGIEFYRKGGCVSCHHNLLGAMTVATVRSRGFSVDDMTAREEQSLLTGAVEAARDATLQGASVGGGGATTTGYIMMGLSAAQQAPDAITDELVRLLRLTQLPDGHWRTAFRPPSESSEITATAVSLRGLRLYGRTQNNADVRAIAAAQSWLEKAVPQNTEDRVFRLFGLSWAGASPRLLKSATRDLVATQRADGGWAQLPSLGSDAYATGSALVALHEAGMSVTSTTYRRGVQYLLKTQHADGSWLVKTRAHRTQVYFESGFPHGVHQFISAAGTNWATQALALASAQPPTRR